MTLLRKAHKERYDCQTPCRSFHFRQRPLIFPPTKHAPKGGRSLPWCAGNFAATSAVSTWAGNDHAGQRLEDGFAAGRELHGFPVGRQGSRRLGRPYGACWIRRAATPPLC